MKTDPNVTAALDRARTVQAERIAAEAAATSHAADTLPALQKAREGTAQSLAEVEAQHFAALVAGDDGAAAAAEAQRVIWAADHAAACDALERAQRVGAVLRERLRLAEVAQAAEVVVLRGVVMQHGQSVTQQLADELREAVAPLAAVVRRAAAVAGAIGSPHLFRTLDELHVPCLRNPAAPLLRGRFPGRLGDDEAAALAAAVGEPRRLLSELENFVPLATREAAAAAQHGRDAGRDTSAVTPPSVATEDTPAAPRVLPAAARRGRVASAAVRLA